MNVRDFKVVHFVGIGGINMSAVAKLLLAAGVRVSGSDVAENEQTKILAERGVAITIGHAAENIPADAQVIVYTSAAPETNSERVEAKKRGLPEYTNFQFLGAWYESSQLILIAGTHGKSTTTAMAGVMFEAAGFDPTVIVGSKVPEFADGNLRIGGAQGVIIEGDEYAKHFLEFHPYCVVLTNVELDHTDIFPTIDDMEGAFVELISRMKPEGVVIANVDSPGVRRVLKKANDNATKLNLQLVTFGMTSEDAHYHVSREMIDGKMLLVLKSKDDRWAAGFHMPGNHNLMNAAAAGVTLTCFPKANREAAGEALAQFRGIWRRFEYLGEKNGAKIFSDYGHHPTAVAATLEAAKEQFPQSRIVLCFQPHHRNRTKNLFLEFIPSFDLADVFVLCEIYDVAGRDASEDENVSSKDLLDAVVRHDADRSATRTTEYAANPGAAVEQTMKLVKEGDVVIFMGAGDIDAAVRRRMTSST